MKSFLQLEREKLRSQMVSNYHEHKVQDHQRILQRRRIIEDRKEYIERLNTAREEEEQRRYYFLSLNLFHVNSKLSN